MSSVGRPQVDELTGLPSRLALTNHYTQVQSQSSADVMFALVAMDLDRFVHVNYVSTHVVADAALRDVADAISGQLPEHAFAGRISGDQFAMIAAVGGPDEAMQFAERLRIAICQALLPYCTAALRAHVADTIGSARAHSAPNAIGEGLGDQPLTASLGVLCFRGDDDRAFDELLREALARVDAAKFAGRNRVWAMPATGAVNES